MANFSSEVILLAQESERKYGVPASVTLAQYALESGYGKSTLAKTKNNYFGMRNGSKGWQSFDSMAESFDAHGQLLAKPLYADKTKGAASAEEYIYAIAETYAPSSDGNAGYAEKIMKIINDNNLTQYDGGNYGAGVAASAGSTKTNTLQSVGNSVLGAIIKGITVIVVGVLAVVLFMSAFDLKIPSKTDVVKKVVEKSID